MLYKDFINDRQLVDKYVEMCPDAVVRKYKDATKVDLAVHAYNLLHPDDKILVVDPIYYDKVIEITESDNTYKVITVEGNSLLIKSSVKPTPIITITSGSYYEPCIGNGPHWVSGGRWVAPRPEDILKKITIDGVKVVCYGHDPAFCVGSYGSEVYPEIELHNNGELITTDTDREILFPPIAVSGSTKHTSFIGYSCNGDYAIQQKEVGMDKVGAPLHLHPDLYTQIRSYEDKYNIVMLPYLAASSARELSYLSEDSIYYGASLLILGYEPKSEHEFIDTVTQDCITLMHLSQRAFCKKFGGTEKEIKETFKQKVASTLEELNKLSPKEQHAYDALTNPWELGTTKAEHIFNWLNRKEED